MIQVTDDFVKKMFLTSQSILHLIITGQACLSHSSTICQIRCKNAKWDGDTVQLLLAQNSSAEEEVWSHPLILYSQRLLVGTL